MSCEERAMNLCREAVSNQPVSLTRHFSRHRCDPGPTHLDTVTFQVQARDGMVLQYKGYVDRGARFEAKYSKRKVKVSGACTFQDRAGRGEGEDYRRDILPIYSGEGGMTTRFVMRKAEDSEK